jgi:hemerythrin-like domain-containing protein
MSGDQVRWVGSLRPLLIRDHERLDALFVKLLEEFRHGDRNTIRAMWTRFEAGLSRHLDAEERHLLPLFARVEPAEAAWLLAEHASFRKKLDELGVGVDLHVVSLAIALEFVESLRAHAHREDRLFYRWAERQAAETIQKAVARGLGVTSASPTHHSEPHREPDSLRARSCRHYRPARTRLEFSLCAAFDSLICPADCAGCPLFASRVSPPSFSGRPAPPAAATAATPR